MKLGSLLVVSVVSLAGCNDAQKADDSHSEMNAWMVESHYDDMTDRAIVSQHTLFPHHFVAGGTELTPQGKKHLTVLSGHYRKHPGAMNVRRGEASDELYADRVEAVKAFMTAAGVDSQKVSIADEFSGGDGITSNDFNKAVEARPATEGETTSSDSNTAEPQESP